MKPSLKLAVGLIAIASVAGNISANPYPIYGSANYSQAHTPPMGFYEIGYNDTVYNLTYNVSPSNVSTYNLQSYVDSNGLPQEGLHIFANSSTGEVGFYFDNIDGPPTSMTMMEEITAAEAAISEPDPQQATQRLSSSMRARARSRMAGIHAGVENVLPNGETSSIHFEYNYLDIGLDNPAAGLGFGGSANVYSLGYEMLLTNNVYVDLNYEYSEESLRTRGGAAVDTDTHTVAGSISADLVNNVYGMLIFGGAFSNGGTTVGGVQFANADGRVLFLNPGLGTNWAFGNLVIDGSLSYLYQNASTNVNIGGVSIAGGANVGQVIVDVGARYNFTDRLYARAGAQYNNIVEENFAAGTALDKNWVQLNTEIGLDLDCGATVYAGHAFDAGHSIYDTHTVRAGFAYSF